jgi:methylenetetrahydrofolate reductase (NADPH)
MKVTEHYAKASQALISFEIIPPKRGSSVNQVFDSLDMVKKYHPPFVDITAHAAEAYYEELKDGTVKRHVKRKRPGTIGLSAAIKHRYDVDPVPHIICHGFTKEETEDALIELNFLGIENVLAIRGDATDAPKVASYTREKNEYAVDLVRQIQDMNNGDYLENMIDAQPTNFCVGVGGYPEKHIEAPNLSWDIDRLKDKVEAGAEYIVTQMFFDNQHYFDFVDKCREANINVPIVPGIKVLNNTRQLTALPKFFHLNIPEELANSVMKDPKNVENIGIEWAQKQCRELLEHDVCGLHFYIMSNPTSAVNVIDKLGLH